MPARKRNDVAHLIERLDAFEADYPAVLKHTRRHTRDALEALRLLFPTLKTCLRDMSEVGELGPVAAQGAATLSEAVGMLGEVRTSTEKAVGEIFDAVDRMHGLLERGLGVPAGAEETLAEIQRHLTQALNALQFQDLVFQQIRAIEALLTGLETGLKRYAETLGEAPGHPVETDITDGTFDPRARFDRDHADASQADIDSWIENVPGARPENP